MRKVLTFLLLFGVTACLAVSGQGEVYSWVGSSKVGPGISHNNLVIYPIIAPRQSLPKAMTLDQALLASNIKVTELDEHGSVNTLRVSNSGGVPVFIMAGEILDGAKQDRVLQQDLWLPARSGSISVSAFCVEQGRWSYDSGSKDFQTTSTIANVYVRAQASSNKNQGQVWQAVQETQSKAGFEAPTSSLNDAYKDRKVQANVDGYLEAFKSLPREHDEMLGVVVQVGDKIVAVDSFGSRDLLVELWPKMLKSYALEAVACEQKTAEADQRQAQQFLRSALKTKLAKNPNPGAGSLFELKSETVSGSTLMLREGVVHLDLFERKRTMPRPNGPAQNYYNVEIEQNQQRD